MHYFKFEDKYGKELRCPNTLGKYSSRILTELLEFKSSMVKS